MPDILKVSNSCAGNQDFNFKATLWWYIHYKILVIFRNKIVSIHRRFKLITVSQSIHFIKPAYNELIKVLDNCLLVTIELFVSGFWCIISLSVPLYSVSLIQYINSPVIDPRSLPLVGHFSGVFLFVF